MSIKIENLAFCYPNMPIFSQLSLSFSMQGFIGIIGPNGGGKTTFLKLLAGLVQPQKGIITINGRSPGEYSPQIGYVPQNSLINKDFPISVLDVVLLGNIKSCKFLGAFPARVKNKALELLDMLEIRQLANKPFSEVSGGEAQRTLFARALIRDPKILFLDEPTANIDWIAEKKIFEILRQLKTTKTILMVTHDLETLLHTASSVLLVNKDIKAYQPEKICRHFMLGLYHDPLPGESM